MLNRVKEGNQIFNNWYSNAVRFPNSSDNKSYYNGEEREGRKKQKQKRGQLKQVL